MGIPSYSRAGEFNGEWAKAIPGSESGLELLGPKLPMSEFGYAEGGPVEMGSGGDLLKYLRPIVESPIKAWHGSPHIFDKFDSSKLGTGEGVQMFGPGLYFAENPEVAKWYRETLSGDPRTSLNQIFTWMRDDPSMTVDRYAGANASHLGDLLRSMRGLQKYADDDTVLSTIRQLMADPGLPRNSWAPDSIRAFKRLDDYFGTNPLGALYEVGIHEDPQKFLSLDRPLHMQGKIGDRAAEIFSDVGGRPYDPLRPLIANPSHTFADPIIREPDVAAQMLQEGIPGVRYFDGASRRRGAGTQNFVTFPGADDLIEIIQRHAEGGSVDDDLNLYQSQYYSRGGYFSR
jgi:hypothetical protein